MIGDFAMNTNKEILARMEEDIRLRGLAEGTRRSYLMNAGQFLRYAGRLASELDEEDIRRYLSYLIDEKKLAVGCVNTQNAAIRFLFGVTLNRNINYRQIPRLRQVRSLPGILTKDELRRIFESASTLRNKAMIMTLYGGGLRLSEICKLRVSDIDSESMRIFINHGKGGKDRYTILSQTNLEILREYWREYRPRHPDGWLFLSGDGSSHSSCRMVQDAFKAALKRAGITKHATVHTLRTCFATHMLESGVDVCKVKQLLGHTHIQSTTFYLHLLNIDPKIKSPLDSMPKKRGRKAKQSGDADA
jgi:site-specific recombinase XerD